MVEIEPHCVVLAPLELVSLLSLPPSGIVGMHHHTWPGVSGDAADADANDAGAGACTSASADDADAGSGADACHVVGLLVSPSLHTCYQRIHPDVITVFLTFEHLTHW